MAAVAEVAESVAEPELYHDVNAGGTAAVARAALRAGVRRLVFSSTAAVYGEPDEVPIPESASLHPSNPYGQSKLDAELALAAAVTRSDGELRVVVLRYFNACGADGERGEDHHPESHLVPLALRAARDGGELQVFGDDYPTPTAPACATTCTWWTWRRPTSPPWSRRRAPTTSERVVATPSCRCSTPCDAPAACRCAGASRRAGPATRPAWSQLASWRDRDCDGGRSTPLTTPSPTRGRG